MAITPIAPAGWDNNAVSPSPRGEKAAGSFVDTLTQALSSVEDKTRIANDAVAGMLNGTTEVHETMLALHEAEEAVELSVAVKNKFVQAYQEIMRMPL